MVKYRKSGDCYTLSTRNKKTGEDINWVTLYFGPSFQLTYETCGYFENYPRINISLFFFTLTIALPSPNEWINECDPPKWGVAIHNNTFWIYKGGEGNLNGGNKWWTWDIPFFTTSWVRTSILLKDNTWAHETPGNNQRFYDDEWKQKQMSWDYDFTDKTDNTVIPTKIYVEEREWRPKWLTWTKKFAKVRRTIDIHFSAEVGRRKGSWKGGVIGCGYDLQPNEHPIDCIKRMEFERDL